MTRRFVRPRPIASHGSEDTMTGVVSMQELELELVEQLPGRELMCGCGCGNNTVQFGLINIDDSVIQISVL
jgi:hypothetical protein